MERIESRIVAMDQGNAVRGYVQKGINQTFLDRRIETPLKVETLDKSDKEKISKVVIGLNEILTPAHTSLKFEYHEKLNEYYVTLINDNTKEVIKEIPSKKLLDFYAEMKEAIGLMIDQKI